MKLCPFLVLGWVLQQFSANAQQVEVWQSKELNCALSLPPSQGWTRVPPQADVQKVAMRHDAGAKTISLYVIAAPKDAQTLKSFIPEFKTSWFREGVSTDRSEETLQIDGRSAHRLIDTVKLQGVDMHRVSTIIIDNGMVYQIAAMSRWSDPLTDPELLETTKSFRFLGQGSKPSTRSAAQEPAVVRTPKWIGRITGWVIVGIVVVFAMRAHARKRAKF